MSPLLKRFMNSSLQAAMATCKSREGIEASCFREIYIQEVRTDSTEELTRHYL